MLSLLKPHLFHDRPIHALDILITVTGEGWGHLSLSTTTLTTFYSWLKINSVAKKHYFCLSITFHELVGNIWFDVSHYKIGEHVSLQDHWSTLLGIFHHEINVSEKKTCHMYLRFMRQMWDLRSWTASCFVMYVCVLFVDSMQYFGIYHLSSIMKPNMFLIINSPPKHCRVLTWIFIYNSSPCYAPITIENRSKEGKNLDPGTWWRHQMERFFA